MQRTIPPIVASMLLILGPVGVAWADQKQPSPKRGAPTQDRGTFHPLADVPEVEPNNNPAQAQAVPCGNSLAPAALMNVAAVPDSDWIRFTANAGELITFETVPEPPELPFTDTIIHLFADDGTTSLAVNDDASPGTLYSRIAEFPAPYTGLYYGRIRGFSGSQGPYRAQLACVAPPPPPPNDQCAGAIALGSGPIQLSGTTRFASNDYDLCPGEPVCPTSCTGFHSPGKDIAFRLDIGRAGDFIDVTYEVSPVVTDASIYIVTDCGDVHGTCVAGQDSSLGAPPERLKFVFPSPGGYYLILDAFSPGGGAWTLTGELSSSTPVGRPLTWGKLKTLYR